MVPIGVGLIGYGLGGRAFHAPYVSASPDFCLKAVVSRDAAKVHADHPGVTVLPSVKALLAEPEIDLVIVSSPDALHAEHALAALAAGKHVLVDKPFATTLDEARQVAAAAESAGRSLTVFHNRRWDADFLTLRQLIAEGALGEIVQFESHFDRWRPAAAETWKEARAGGSWLDLGPHLVDQALQLFGMPDAVHADLAGLRDGAPAPDYFHVTLIYPQRRVLLHSTKLAAAHTLRFAVHGTCGSWIKHGIDRQEAAILAGGKLSDRDWGLDPDDGVFTRAADMSERLVRNERGDYRRFWTALARALRREGANPVPAVDAVAVMAMLDAGLRSAIERRTVNLA